MLRGPLTLGESLTVLTAPLDLVGDAKQCDSRSTIQASAVVLMKSWLEEWKTL